MVVISPVKGRVGFVKEQGGERRSEEETVDPIEKGGDKRRHEETGGDSGSDEIAIEKSHKLLDR